MSSGPERLGLDVIIVTATGGRDLLWDCLESLQNHPPRSARMRVQVVDNRSEDGTDEMLRLDFPEVERIRLDRNLGFARANNKALRRSAAPLVLLLNPDTVVSEGALDHMVASMRERPDVAVAGCRLVKRNGEFDHAAKRSFPTPLSSLAYFLRLSRLPVFRSRSYLAPELDDTEAGEVDSVNGAFMLVRRKAIDEVGLLDEGYWMYGEDLDWCYRFKSLGWRVWYDGQVTVLHVKGGTTGTGERHHRGLRTNVAFHRAMGRFYRKFHSGGSMDLPVYLAIVAKLAVSVARSTAARKSLI